MLNKVTFCASFVLTCSKLPFSVDDISVGSETPNPSSNVDVVFGSVSATVALAVGTADSEYLS